MAELVGDPSVEIPLVDWGTLALRAGRVGPVLPHMAWLLRFDEPLTREALEAEARRLASTPYGLGRRIVAPRVPGGRPRWRPTTEPGPVELAAQPAVGPAGMSAWLDRQLGVPLDPEHDAGWRIAATPTGDGGTAVLVTVHHLFGTGRGILGPLYAAGEEDPTSGTTEARFERASDYTLRAEVDGVRERVALGAMGLGRLVAAAPAALRRADGKGNGAGAGSAGPAPIRPPRGRDRTRGPFTHLRVAAIATLPGAEWDAAGARHGGTGNTLLAAVAGNLLRRARIARGGPAHRPLRLLLPVDLGDREVAERFAQATSGPAANMTTAAVVVPGGPPDHGDLRDLRARMKAAFIADAGSAPAVRGAGDVMRLLPEALTFRAAARAAQQFDGCASNVGEVPAGMLRLGRHEAREVAMLGWPIGNEALTALIRYRDQVAVSVVTDPSRLGPGPGPDLRGWVADELEAWGLSREVVL